MKNRFLQCKYLTYFLMEVNVPLFIDKVNRLICIFFWACLINVAWRFKQSLHLLSLTDLSISFWVVEHGILQDITC